MKQLVTNNKKKQLWRRSPSPTDASIECLPLRPSDILLQRNSEIEEPEKKLSGEDWELGTDSLLGKIHCVHRFGPCNHATPAQPDTTLMRALGSAAGFAPSGRLRALPRIKPRRLAAWPVGRSRTRPTRSSGSTGRPGPNPAAQHGLCLRRAARGRGGGSSVLITRCAWPWAVF